MRVVRLALPLLLLFPLALVSCSVGGAVRRGFDEAREYAHSPEGQAAVQVFVDKGVDAAISKLGKVGQDASLPPWGATAATLGAAILTAYASYQRGHRTGEDKGWKDGTGDGSNPKA